MTKVEQIVCESLTHRGYAVNEALQFLRVIKGEEPDPTPYDDRDYDALELGMEEIVKANKSLQGKLARARERLKEIREG